MANWTWHAKPMGSYAMGSTEGDDNACLIASWLMINYGWTLEAVCGMLGNIAGEGGLNPWQYEISHVPTSQDIPTYAQAASAGYGMGLIGWTPCRKYTVANNTFFPEWDLSTFPGYGPNFSDQPGNTQDANAQTELIGKCMVGNGHRNFWIRSRVDEYNNIHYNWTADEYIALTDLEQATKIWLWQAEYPQSIHPPANPTQTENRRIGFAQAWYQHLIDIGFHPSLGGFPYWLLLAKKAQEFNNRI